MCSVDVAKVAKHFSDKQGQHEEMQVHSQLNGSLNRGPGQVRNRWVRVQEVQKGEVSMSTFERFMSEWAAKIEAAKRGDYGHSK